MNIEPPVSTFDRLASAPLGYITHAAWSPDGTMLAVAHGGGIALWQDGFSAAPTRTMERDAPVKALAWRRDGMLAAGGALAVVELIHPHTGDVVRKFNAGNGAIQSLAISLDQQRIIAGDDEGSLWMWHHSSGERLFHSSEYWSDRWQSIKSVAALPNRAEGSMTTPPLPSVGYLNRTPLLSNEEVVMLIDRTGAYLSPTIPFHEGAVPLRLLRDIRSAALNVGHTRAAFGSTDGGLLVGRIRDPDFPAEFTNASAHEGRINTLAFQPHPPDGDLLVSGGRDGVIRVWPLRDPFTPSQTLTAHDKPVLTLAFHPSGRFFISGGGDHRLYLWGLSDAKDTNS